MRVVLTVAYLFASATVAHGVTAIAFDNAADPAYSSAWTYGSNGGYGFEPWRIVTTDPKNTGAFIGDASTNGGAGSGQPGSSGGAINAAGKSFELYANPQPPSEGGQNQSIGVGRTFPALAPRQTFAFDLDPGKACCGMTASLRNIVNGGGVALELSQQVPPHYLWSDLDHFRIDTGVLASSDGAHFSFNLTGPNAYSIALTDIDS